MMTKTHEKLLVAVLAGLIIAGAAAFAIQPAVAGKTTVRGDAQFATAADTVLDLRLVERT